tara:strand:- start:35550 stop:37196 length:1647 start_codon:yes stop_codon:yes gene_type:complete
MAIKRYKASKDTTISNSYDFSLLPRNRATGSNMGAADTLEIFSIYGQVSSSGKQEAVGLSSELSRVLIGFPVSGSTETIGSDRNAGKIPVSGNVKFFLRMFNAKHAATTPRNIKLVVAAVSASADWEEGTGIDLDEYKDKTHDEEGANWIRYASNKSWDRPGGTFYIDSTSSYTTTLEKGDEDIELDVTSIVEYWLKPEGNAQRRENRGFAVFLTSSQEAYHSASKGYNLSLFQGQGATGSVIHNPAGAKRSYYTKKFFARTSEFFFKQPVLEARWDSTVKDRRGDCHYSSSMVSAQDNLNTIYLYNYVRGRLQNIPSIGTGEIFVTLYSGSADNNSPSINTIKLPQGGGVSGPAHTLITGGYVSTGIYSASFAITAASNPLSRVFDVWHSEIPIGEAQPATEFWTGSINVKAFKSYTNAPSFEYVTAIPNLKASYSKTEVARFRLYVRDKDWNPNIYTKATNTPDNTIIESGSFKVVRLQDNLNVISYGTGSNRHTHTSFDVSGNYFDLDMDLLQEDYTYGIKLAYYNDHIGGWTEQPEIFKFRVED